MPRGHRDVGRQLDALAHIIAKDDIKKIAVVHGEESQALAFGRTLRALKPKAEVVVPEYQQVLEL